MKSNFIILIIISFIIIYFIIIYQTKCQLSKNIKTISINDLKSGDLILFRSYGRKGFVGANLLKIIGQCPFNHLGLIAKGSDSEYYVWEIVSKSNGSRLFPLKKIIEKYPNEIYIRPLLQNNQHTGISDRKIFNETIQKLTGKNYSYYYWLHVYSRLFKWIPLPDIKCEHNYYCTKLAAETLYQSGIIYPYNIESLVIKDFVSTSENLIMKNNYKFDKEMKLII